MAKDVFDLVSGGKQGEASDFASEATSTLRGVKIPEIRDMELKLQQLVSQGEISPEEAQVYLQEQTANITSDPRLKSAQMGALGALQDISANGGMTAADRANLAQIGNDEATQQRGAREAILANSAQRGIAGSGLATMSQLQNSQQSAMRQNQRDLGVAGQAQDRALQAMLQGGQLAGQMQGQDFSQQLQQNSARDAINRFNTQNTQQVGLVNTGYRNDAQARNTAEGQRIADSNVGIANDQQINNKGLHQLDFQNRTGQATGVAGGLGSQASLAQRQGESNTKIVGDVIKGASSAAAMSDERVKKDVQDFDPSSFLESLTAHKYKYKDPANGQGEQVGVMAQDLEKGAPQMVQDTPEGKVVDYNKAGGPLFASLASLHERLKKIEGGGQ